MDTAIFFYFITEIENTLKKKEISGTMKKIGMEGSKMKIQKKEWFTIPNIMGYFRILLIPVFAWIYLNASSEKDYYLAAAVIGISGLTALFDGKIARKFHMVTELGKFLDPLADKITLGALILCMTTRFEGMKILIVLFLIKEGFMAAMGALMLRHNGRKLDGAKWFGKVCTAFSYVTIFVLMLFPNISKTAADGWMICCEIGRASCRERV